ncbi:leucine-rich repeat protein (LRRP) [Diplonema papillatum]|nr:leucine-rich repeat protein (LRRP) [Diplonema papillatum]
MAMHGVEVPTDPAQAVFEPTGDLFKDYCAYCETEDRDERDDILDGITLVDEKDSPRNLTTQHNVHTKLFIRAVETPLHRNDMSPLANSMTHCANLYEASFFGCQLSNDSYKLLVEAAYKSPSLVSLAVEFNQTPLGKDPSSTKKDPQECYLFPHQARGAGRMEAAAASHQVDPKVGKTASPAAGKAKGNTKPETTDEREKPAPIRVPDGWHAVLLSNVQDISLRGNAITDRQVKLLATALESATELLSLNLWGNSITDEGAAALSEALRMNCRLTALDVGDNRITDEGACALVSSVSQVDLDLERFAVLRGKISANFYSETMPADAPAYPSYADLHQINQQLLEAGAGKDKKPAPKKGKDVSAPTPKPTSPWDMHCISVGGNTVRVPGNKTLWCLSLANNKHMTEKGCQTIANMLRDTIAFMREKPEEESPIKAKDPKAKQPVDIPTPRAIPTPPPTMAGCALQRLVIASPHFSKDVLKEIQDHVASLHVPPSADEPP